MNKTAWASRGSSLPSDRIPSKANAAQPAKAKGKQKDAGPPKSKDVLRLEKLRDDLRKATGTVRDPKGGCFCQARMHPLSPHTPICRACGLVLCELNPPHFACPHCGAALLVPAARTALADALDTQVADTLAREADERARAVQEARAAQGAFPTLSASSASSAAASRASTPGPDTQAAHPVNQTHKVLSLNPKTKRVTVKSHTPPAVSRAASKENLVSKPAAAAAEPEYKRVPAPPPEVVVVSRTLAQDAQRPWANARPGGLNVTYVPPSRV